MKDPWNPTCDELEQWARMPGAMYPEQDWELVIPSDENANLFLRLADDPTCVNRGAVLNFLYIYAGQVVRERRSAERTVTLKAVIEQARTLGSDVALWANRAADVLEGRGPDPRYGAPREDYDFWFAGGWRNAAPNRSEP